MDNLHKAIQQNDISQVRLLLEENSTILHLKNENGFSALDLAHNSGNLNIIAICKEFAEQDGLSTSLNNLIIGT